MNKPQHNTQNVEIEIKIKASIKTTEHINTWLKENAIFQSEMVQEEYYLDNPNDSWFLQHESGYRYALKYLRVRITQSGASICFKGWVSSSTPKTYS